MGHYNYNWIMHNINCDRVFFKASNKAICLLGVSIVPNMVTILEETALPLWKQQMNMSMGIMKTKTIDIRQYKTYEIKQLHRYDYEISTVS